MTYAAGYGLFLAAAVASMHGDPVRHLSTPGRCGRLVFVRHEYPPSIKMFVPP
jgi:hypothetical protein